ncbi:ferredoxin/adrenodoxin [Anaeramoeba ignava]|uniref:Ferredoxin/adrenodoxin n=1 Tax=Anaeramoeba ignava TaxID=1746090 RepID=A0A9Q0LD85_ANAIG|nr:ferredoxin/adrenodoxin [Anaeramoeba ignava]
MNFLIQPTFNRNFKQIIAKQKPKILFQKLSNLTSEKIKIIFKLPDGSKKTVEGKTKETVLDVAKRSDIPLEGACEGNLACSTCHCYLKNEHFDLFKEPSDREYDLLDLAFAVKQTSRLACQLVLQKKHDGIEIEIPKTQRNMAVDGYISKH